MTNNGMIGYACTNSNKIAPFFIVKFGLFTFSKVVVIPTRLKECKSWWIQGVAAKKKHRIFKICAVAAKEGWVGGYES